MSELLTDDEDGEDAGDSETEASRGARSVADVRTAKTAKPTGISKRARRLMLNWKRRLGHELIPGQHHCGHFRCQMVSVNPDRGHVIRVFWTLTRYVRLIAALRTC